jgi:hypothetical protein
MCKLTSRDLAPARLARSRRGNATDHLGLIGAARHHKAGPIFAVARGAYSGVMGFLGLLTCCPGSQSACSVQSPIRPIQWQF